MLSQIPRQFQPEVLPGDTHAIRISEILDQGWSSGWVWVVTDRDGLIEYASGNVDLPSDAGFRQAIRTARKVAKSAAEAEALIASQEGK